MWTSKQLGTRPRTRTTQIHFLELELKLQLRKQMTQPVTFVRWAKGLVMFIWNINASIEPR